MAASLDHYLPGGTLSETGAFWECHGLIELVELGDECFLTRSLLHHPFIELASGLSQSDKVLDLGRAPRRNVEAYRTAVLGDGNGLVSLQLGAELLPKLPHASAAATQAADPPAGEWWTSASIAEGRMRPLYILVNHDSAGRGKIDIWVAVRVAV